eukprot:2354655-Prymnesium_polylepis.1
MVHIGEGEPVACTRRHPAVHDIGPEQVNGARVAIRAPYDRTVTKEHTFERHRGQLAMRHAQAATVIRQDGEGPGVIVWNVIEVQHGHKACSLIIPLPQVGLASSDAEVTPPSRSGVRSERSHLHILLRTADQT